MNTSQLEILAPLQNFLWEGDNFELSPGLWIRRFDQKPDLRELDTKELSRSEQDAIGEASHWLSFNWHKETELSPAETVNLSLVALWLVKPTASHVAFRFALGQGEDEGQKGIARLYDRFAWLPEDVHEGFEITDLQAVSSYLSNLVAIGKAKGRLHNALILTMTGCWSHEWQSALICHAAATEALLTYSSDPGIRKRLARSYACLIETQSPQRNTAYKDFHDLYPTRSDIMHGHSYTVNPTEPLLLLRRFQNLLRNLWRTALLSSQLISTLEGSDAQRRIYFSQITSGYTPP